MAIRYNSRAKKYYFFFKRFLFCLQFVLRRCSEKLQDIVMFCINFFALANNSAHLAQVRGHLVTCCEMHLGASLKTSQRLIKSRDLIFTHDSYTGLLSLLLYVPR